MRWLAVTGLAATLPSERYDMADAPTMYLLDTHALIYQMFHAVPPMTAPDGRATNAVFGIVRDVLNILDEVRPTYLISAFDLPGPTFRNKLYDEYKAHRPEPPVDLAAQVPLVQEVLEAMNVACLSVPGFEADDVMATVATAAAARGIQVSLCTSDKDCRQVISDRVRMYNLRKKTVLDAAALYADWGVTPTQVVDFQSLVGDSVDNVPGVAGIGEKTAAKLLQEYGTLDNLVKHAEEIKQKKLKENLLAAIHSGDLERSRTLVRLVTDVPLDMNWDEWRVKPWDGPKLLPLFEQLGFRSYSNRVRSSMKSVGKAKNNALLEAIGVVAPASKSGMTQGDLFAGTPEDVTPAEFPFAEQPPAPPRPEWIATYTAIDTPEKWSVFLEQLRAQPRFSFDLETTGLDPLRSQIVGFAFCWKSGEAYYVPVRGPKDDAVLDPTMVLNDLRPLFESPTIQKVNQNIKFDRIALGAAGIALQGVAGDSMIAHYLLHAGERTHNLDELSEKFLLHENITIESLIGKGKHQKSMADVPVAKVCAYAAEDADVAWRLTEMFEPQLAPEGLRKIYDEIEVPLISVLGDMETTGVRLDVPFLKRLSSQMAERLAEVETQIYQMAGKEFNIASLKQLRDVLYVDLNLPILRRTGLSNEPSTDQDTLEKLAALGHAVPKALMEHRQISKLKGTYVDALPELVNPDTGRLHTSFNQTVAATGRLSSSDPNLQNVPTRTDMGREIRQAFLPREGWTLIAADYSQIELRMLAHFSGDANLRTAYEQNQDVHTQVAGEIFGVGAEQVTSDMRRVAKTVNFGVIYGMSAFGLAERLGLSRKDAERFIDQYFAKYPKVLSYQDALLAKARRDGHVTSILGRKRKFDQNSIRAKTSYKGRNQAEREAINMEIQASAADLIKLAMLNIDRRLQVEGKQAKMLLTVHDELVFEAPPEEVDEVSSLVRQEMVGAMKLNVPLEVDVATGPNWLDVE